MLLIRMTLQFPEFESMVCVTEGGVQLYFVSVSAYKEDATLQVTDDDFVVVGSSEEMMGSG